MKGFKRIIKKEDGSATIEFLGILPLVFIILMIILQIIVGVYSVMVAQSAANEYANVYSVTENTSEAQHAANKILSTAGNYLNASFTPSVQYKEFSVAVTASIDLIFLPDEILGNTVPSISYSTTAYSRVIE